MKLFDFEACLKLHERSRELRQRAVLQVEYAKYIRRLNEHLRKACKAPRMPKAA